MSPRTVYLIGAGPGDPGLLTIRGLECIQSADVVVHDHDVASRIVGHARADAEVIDVGRDAPDPGAHQAITLLMAEKAREGKVVARLKRGDPLVADRGVDEALFLREQGIPFEIVPGVAIDLAVPTYAGVPARYAGGAESVTLLRANEQEGGTPAVDWNSLARLRGTVICHAAAPQLGRVLASLEAHGRPGDEPALLVRYGTLPTQESLTGTIATTQETLRGWARRDRATLIVGSAVGFRAHLRWFDTRPLFGQRVLVTRPRDQAAELVDRLTALGASAIEAPMVAIAAPEDREPLREAAARAGTFDWIVFTSVNSVDGFMAALHESHRDLRALAGPLLCAVGSATAARLARHGLIVDVVPREFRAEAVFETMASRGTLAGRRVLLPRADIGREVIATDLRQAGAEVTEVVAYRTVPCDPRAGDPDVYGLLLAGQIDIVTFTSPSAVRQFVQAFGADQSADLLRRTVVATIGPVTAEAATQLGIRVTVQPATYTVPALVDTIAAHVSAHRRSP